MMLRAHGAAHLPTRLTRLHLISSRERHELGTIYDKMVTLRLFRAAMRTVRRELRRNQAAATLFADFDGQCCSAWRGLSSRLALGGGAMSPLRVGGDGGGFGGLYSVVALFRRRSVCRPAYASFRATTTTNVSIAYNLALHREPISWRPAVAKKLGEVDFASHMAAWLGDRNAARRCRRLRSGAARPFRRSTRAGCAGSG